MYELRTNIEIAATPERVWSILTDFAAYPQWNPFVRSIKGAPVVGSMLEVCLQPPGARPMTFRPTVLVAEPLRELRWLGRVLLPGIFDGEHRFAIVPLSDGRVRFEHSERFRGILIPILRRSLEKDTTAGFAEMNAALKKRAET